MPEPSRSFPFPEWRGQRTQPMALSPDGTPFVVPSGAHERLHALVVGQAKGSPPRGTKVELALAGRVQLQGGELIDRVNVDAPDGFADAEVLRRFATMHDAGIAWLAFHPSGDTLKLRDPRSVTFTRSGPRVPVPLDLHAGSRD